MQRQYTKAERLARNELFAQGLKLCGRCGEIKPVSDYGVKRTAYGGLHTYCKPCYNRYRIPFPRPPFPKTRNRRDTILRNKYRITLDEFEERLALQGGKCAICGTTSPNGVAKVFNVDHDHLTKDFRGVLCWECNVGLGKFHDDPKILLAAAKYLSDWESRRQGVFLER